MQIKGIGKVKAIQLKAVCELGVRMSKPSNYKKIKIKSPSDNNISQVLLPDYKSTLKNGKLVISKIEDYNIYRWKEGLYCFDDVPFSGILDKLEKYYNVKISVTSPRLLTHEGLTGKFREQDGIEHILRTISKEHPFKFSINEAKDSIIIYE